MRNKKEFNAEDAESAEFAEEEAERGPIRENGVPGWPT
jgi:hypothetical protein